MLQVLSFKLKEPKGKDKAEELKEAAKDQHDRNNANTGKGKGK